MANAALMEQIKFGDVVCLGDVEARGFLTGDPFLTDDVYLDSFESFDLKSVGRDQLQTFFVIEHAYEFSAAKAFKRKLRKAPTRLSEKTWRTELDPSDPLCVELEQLHARKEDEKATNEVEAKRIAGLPVCYGNDVQLRQLSSSKLLTQSKNRAALNALALEVFLADEGTKWSIWRILPTVRIRGEGEGAHYGEEVSFSSVKQRSSYLSTFVAPNLLAPHDQFRRKTAPPSVAAPKGWEEAHIIQPEGVEQRFEVNSATNWTKFHLVLVRRHQRTPPPSSEALDQHVPIRPTDVVTICHKQHDLYLVADEPDGVRWLPKEEAWFDSDRPRAHAMWMVMHSQLDHGEGHLTCPSDQLVILHLASGLALRALDPQPGAPARLVLQVPGKRLSKWSLTGQVGEAERQGTLHEGDFVWLQAMPRKGRAGGYLSALSCKATTQTVGAFSPGVPDAFSARSSGRDGRGGKSERFEACLRNTQGGELLDMVELSVVAPGEWQVVDLVRRAAQGLGHIKRCLSASCMPAHDVEPESTREGPCPEDADAEGVAEWFERSEVRATLEALTHVSDISFGVLCGLCDPAAAIPSSPSPAHEGHHPRRKLGRLVHGHGSLYYQDLIREQGALDMALDIVMVGLEESGVPASAMGRAGLLRELLARCFRLVELACKGSADSKQAMAAALPIMSAALVADCGAYGAMLAVYAGTRPLLEGLGPEVFSDTVSSIVSARLPSVLSFAIETCICDDEPIKTNQDRWAAELLPPSCPPPVFLEVQSLRGDYLLKTWATAADGKALLLSLQRTAFVVEGREDTPVPCADLSPEAVVHYHSLAMDLLCALLRGGNPLPRTLVEAHARRLGLESPHLVAMVGNDQLPSSVRARCVQVLQHLYVEQTPVKLPMRNSSVWVWRKLQGSTDNQAAAVFRHARMSWGAENAMEQCSKVKDVAVDNLSNPDNKGDKRKECELEKSLVSLLAALFESGYYHREEDGEMVVDIAEVASLADPLMEVLDDRPTICSVRGREASTQHGRKTSLLSPTARGGGQAKALVDLKVSTLKLLGRLLECCWQCRMELLFEGWETVLAETLHCHSWQDMMAATNEAAAQLPSTDPDNPNRQRREHRLKRPRIFFRKEESLVAFALNPSLWTTKPPWRKGAVEKLARKLFDRHPFMEELSYSQLQSIGPPAGHRVPKVLRILLWQLMHEDMQLKERTLHFLFQAFQQRTAFLRHVREAKFICQPSTFQILPDLLTQVNTLQSVSRSLRDVALPSCAPSSVSSAPLISWDANTGRFRRKSSTSTRRSAETGRPRGLVSWQQGLRGADSRKGDGEGGSASDAFSPLLSSTEGDFSVQARSKPLISWEGLKEGEGLTPAKGSHDLRSGVDISPMGQISLDDPTPVAEMDAASAMRSTDWWRELSDVGNGEHDQTEGGGRSGAWSPEEVSESGQPALWSRSESEAQSAARQALVEAASEATRILRAWEELYATALDDGEHSIEELSQVMQVLKMDPILLSLLSSCPPLRSGSVDADCEAALTKMVAAACVLVTRACTNSRSSRQWWSEHTEVLWQFVGVQSVDAECTLAVIATDDLELLSKHGKEWIARYFGVVAEDKGGQGVTVRGLQFLTRLLTYKGTPMPEHNVRALAYFEDHEATMGALMQGDEEWDRRIEMMEVDELHADTEGELALHVASVDFLAAACVGKSTAAAVYGVHFLPFKHVMRTLVAMHRDTASIDHDIPAHVRLRVKASFLRLVYHVFLDTKTAHLLAERHRLGSGVWQVDEADARVSGCPSLMQTLVADVRSFRGLAHAFIADRSSRSMGEERQLRGMAEYLVWAWVPVVAGVYRQHAATLTEQCHQQSFAVAESLGKELQALVDSTALPPCCATVLYDGRHVSVKDALRSALFEVLVFSRKNTDSEAMAAACKPRAAQRVIRTEEVVAEGLHAFIDSVASYLAVSGTQRGSKAVSGVSELLQLSHFFSLDGKVPLCILTGDEDTPHRCEVANADIVRSVLHMSNTDATGPDVNRLLSYILQTTRAAMYLSEPAHPNLSLEEMEERWEACMRDEKMQKKFEPKAEMLTWVQNKFDTLGCTEAAVRLLSHDSRQVQLDALRLMLTLLQSGNDKVQNNVRVLFSSKSGRGGLQQLKHIISEGVELISVNYKREVKTRKQSGKMAYLWPPKDETDDEEAPSAAGQSGIGRHSMLMLALRVVQLLMEGQNRALQNQIAKAQGGTSVFDQCVRLFLAIQPVLGDSFSGEDCDVAVLCIQVVETVSECIQGPNRVSQQMLLRSNFFAAVNRLLCSITYTPHGAETASKSELGLQPNDLKCWLKFSLLGCCIAVFEAVRDPSELQAFFELVHARNVISQITASAQVLGLPLASQQRQAVGSSELSKLRALRWSTQDQTVAGWMQRSPLARDNHRSIATWMQHAPSLLMRSHKASDWLGSSLTMSATATAPKKSGKSVSADKHVVFEIEEKWKPSFSAPDSNEAMLDELLRMWMLLIMFKEYAVDTAHAVRIQQFEEDEPALARFLEMHTSHIECIRHSAHATRKPVAEKVFFALRPELALLIRSKRFRMKASLEIFNVPRDNPWEKGCEFMKRIKIVHNRVHWLEVVRQSALLDRCIAWRGKLDIMPLYLSGVVTLFLLAVYGLPWDPNTGDVFGGGGFYSFQANMAGYQARVYPYINLTSHPREGATYGEIMSMMDNSLKFRLSLQSRWDHSLEWESFSWARGLLLMLACCHVILTSLACFLHLLIDFPLTVVATLDSKRAQKATHTRDSDKQGKDAVLLATGERLPPLPKPPVTYVTWRELRALLWQSKLTVYYAALMCVSVLGAVSSPFFLVVFLLDTFRGTSGALVVRSLVVGGPNLVRTFVLGVVVLVCFGFFSYAYFSVVINGAQELCHSPFQCVAMHLLDSFTGDLTTVLGDDLGDFAFPGTAVWSDSWQSWRTFVVVVSIVAWVFLLQGIIQGQIIDTFAEMRNKMQEARDDLERKCFVSSVDRFMFQNYPGEWEKRKSGKFAWNYLLYFSHLRRKDPEEYNGMDNLAVKAFEEERADLLPIGTFVAKQREELSHRDSNVHEVVEAYKTELARAQALTASLLAQTHAGHHRHDHPSPSPTARATPSTFSLIARQQGVFPPYMEPTVQYPMSGMGQHSRTSPMSSRPPLWLASRRSAESHNQVAEMLIDGGRSDGSGSDDGADDWRRLTVGGGGGEPEWDHAERLASITPHSIELRPPPELTASSAPVAPEPQEPGLGMASRGESPAAETTDEEEEAAGGQAGFPSTWI